MEIRGRADEQAGDQWSPLHRELDLSVGIVVVARFFAGALNDERSAWVCIGGRLVRARMDRLGVKGVRGKWCNRAQDGRAMRAYVKK